MLSCELCCSFRAVRLLCLILLQQSSLKKPFFFLKCSVVRGLGFIFGCPLRSCPARTQTSHCLPAEAPPCCCEARPGSAVLLCSPPRPAVESLCCSGLPRQRQAASAVGCISVGTGCLSNRWLCQQWACISVGAGCLGNGGRPSPSERLGLSAQGLFEIAVLFIPLGQP